VLVSCSNRARIVLESCSNRNCNRPISCSRCLDCIRTQSTDGNFGTHEKVAIAIPIVTCTLPIPILAYLCSHSHGIPMEMGIPFSCTSLMDTQLLYKLDIMSVHSCHTITHTLTVDDRKLIKLTTAKRKATTRRSATSDAPRKHTFAVFSAAAQL